MLETDSVLACALQKIAGRSSSCIVHLSSTKSRAMGQASGKLHLLMLLFNLEVRHQIPARPLVV